MVGVQVPGVDSSDGHVKSRSTAETVPLKTKGVPMRRLFALIAAATAVSVPAVQTAEVGPAGVPSPESPSRIWPVPDDASNHARSTAVDRESVALTVYNQGFGLVREVRRLQLPRGPVALEYGDVASGIQPETVHVLPLRGEGFRLLEQNYQYDLLNPQKLLEKYVGRIVNVYRPNPATGVDEVVEAEGLSVNGGPILRIDDEITFDYPGRFGFPEMPDNLIAEPTLMWRLDAVGGEERVEVSYLTNSLNWESDYVLVLNEDDDEGSLTGWVTLTNHSGTSFENARLQLVAGDVQRVSGNARPAMYRDRMMEMAMAAEADGFTEDAFFEYHLYTLGRPTDLMNNEQKQVTLLEADGLGVDKQLIFRGSPHYYRGQYAQVTSNQKAGVFLDFDNRASNGLGIPLPRGTVRVYKRDHTGAQQFIGEDLIDHTPRDETLRIRMGEAFDVVGDRRQMDYTVVSNCVSESTWRVDLRNHKDQGVDVLLVEPLGGDWEILSSTHSWDKEDAWTLVLRPRIEARGETVVEYRVRVRWC